MALDVREDAVGLHERDGWEREVRDVLSLIVLACALFSVYSFAAFCATLSDIAVVVPSSHLHQILPSAPILITVPS